MLCYSDLCVNIAVFPCRCKYRSDFLEGEDYEREPEDHMKQRMDELRTYISGLLEIHDTVLLVAHYWTINFLTTVEQEGKLVKTGLCVDNAQLIQFDL